MQSKRKEDVMRYIVNSHEMKNYDRNVIEKYHVPSTVLMERAALACVEVLYEKKITLDRVLIVCGSGNNGGDGYAVARLLLLDGYLVDVVKADPKTKQTEENQLQSDIFQAYGGNVYEGIPKDTTYTVVIDAVFGVGLSREVEGTYATIIAQMNGLPGTKIAIDIPSGISSDNGEILKTAFCADLTVTFAFEKIGTVLWPGNEYAGEVIVKNIGIDERSFLEQKPAVAALEDVDLSRIPLHKSHSNKGTFGRVLIIAGSIGMSGAAYFSAKAAYCSGSGLVRIVTPEENCAVLQTQLPEAIITTFHAKNPDMEVLMEAIGWADTIVCGPGIGKSDTIKNIIKMVLFHASVPVLLDADALNCIAQDTAILHHPHTEVVITPHLGEMSRLCGKTVTDIQHHLIEVAEEFARQYNVVCVLKDEHTIISEPYHQTYLNLSGNSGMATAGSGDVLSGIIGSLIAQGMAVGEAAVTGVYLHGKAGDRMQRCYSKSGLMASDLLEGIRLILCEREQIERNI